MSLSGIAGALGITTVSVCSYMKRAKEAGDPRACFKSKARRGTTGPLSARREAILVAWAAGVPGPGIASTHGMTTIRIRKVVASARRSGDPRATLRQLPAQPDAAEKGRRQRAVAKSRPADYVPRPRRSAEEAAALHEAVLSAWARGDTGHAIAASVGLPPGYVGSMLHRLRAAGDPRAALKRGR
jgi:hypothetical protein